MNSSGHKKMGLALQCTSLGIRMYRTGHKDKQVWEHGQHAWGVCYLKVHINVLPICKYRCRTPVTYTEGHIQNSVSPYMMKTSCVYAQQTPLDTQLDSLCV